MLSENLTTHIGNAMPIIVIIIIIIIISQCASTADVTWLVHCI